MGTRPQPGCAAGTRREAEGTSLERRAGRSRADPPPVRVEAVASANWHDVVGLRVSAGQKACVAASADFLAPCCYDEAGWSPPATALEGAAVGLLMRAVDGDEAVCWLGGITVDARRQGKGIAISAGHAALAVLGAEQALRLFALSIRALERAGEKRLLPRRLLRDGRA